MITLETGLKALFNSVQLNLPCAVPVRDFKTHCVLKRLALALECKAKFWWVGPNQTKCYTIFYSGERIPGREITRLIDSLTQTVKHGG
jgi:hypothetical protein